MRFSCKLLTSNNMISHTILWKYALVNFSKTRNFHTPYMLVQFCCLWKYLLVLINAKLHSKSCSTYTNSKLLLIFLVNFQNSLPLFTNFVQKTTWNQTRGMWSKSLRIWQKILCIWWRFCFLWLQEAIGLACFSHWALLWYSCGWSPFPLRRMPQKNCRDNKIPWKRKNYLMHW